MTTHNNPGANVYSQGPGSTPLSSLGLIPVVAITSPTPQNVQGPSGVYAIGQQWINTATQQTFILAALIPSNGFLTAVWNETSNAIGFLDRLTPDTGGTVFPIAENINILTSGGLFQTVGTSGTITITALSGSYPITPFVVGPVGQAGYQTIQDAMAAAHTAGGGTVYIQPGTYTTTSPIPWYSGVFLAAIPSSQPGASVTIINMTTQIFNAFIGNGSLFKANGISFETSAFNIVNQSGALSGLNFTFEDCLFTTGINARAVLNLPACSGSAYFINCKQTAGVPVDAGSFNIYFTNSVLGLAGGNTMPMPGTVYIDGCSIGGIITLSSTNYQIYNSSFDSQVQISGGGAGCVIDGCTFTATGTSAIAWSSSSGVQLTNTIVSSDQTNTISGSGTGALTVSGLTLAAGNIANTITVVYLGQTLFGGITVIGSTNINTLGSANTLIGNAGGSGFTDIEGITAINTSSNTSTTIGNNTGTSNVTIHAPSGGLALVGNTHAITVGTDSNANSVTVGSITSGSTTTIRGANSGVSIVGTPLTLSSTGGKIVFTDEDTGTSSVGEATLVAGTVVVPTTAVTGTSFIFISVNIPGGTQGFLSAPNGFIVPGVSFQVFSTENADTSSFYWWVIN